MDNDVSRREFLKGAALATAGAAGVLAGSGVSDAQEQAFPMEYRRIGPSGGVVSAIAGNETYKADTLSTAIEYGVNYWHKAQQMRGLGELIGTANRQRHIVDFCLDGRRGNQEYTVAEIVSHFKLGLRNTGLDRAEVFKMHGDHSDNLVQAFAQLKQEGLTAALAASYHDLERAREAVDSGAIDHIQIMASPVSGDDVWQLCSHCKQKGVGVMAMKSKMGGPRKWGDQRFRSTLEPYFKRDDSISVAILRYMLAQEGIVACTPAQPNVQQFETDVEAARRPPTEGERLGMNVLIEGLRGEVCAMCRSCIAACPRGIPVTDILRYDLYFTAYGQPREARRLYRDLPRWRRASACDACGLCERNCPQGLKVVQRLQEAHQRLA